MFTYYNSSLVSILDTHSLFCETFSEALFSLSHTAHSACPCSQLCPLLEASHFLHPNPATKAQCDEGALLGYSKYLCILGLKQKRGKLKLQVELASTQNWLYIKQAAQRQCFRAMIRFHRIWFYQFSIHSTCSAALFLES